MKKVLAMLLVLMLVMSVVFTACGTKDPVDNPAETTDDVSVAPVNTDPWGKYDPPIQATFVRETNAAADLQPGRTYEDNAYTRGLKDELGIELKLSWAALGGEKYDTKMNLAIASNQLPDILSLTSYGQFDKLLKADKLADLTDAYNTYAYPKMKEWYEQDGGIQKAWGTIGGKIMGMSRGGINYQTTRMIHIRKDWFEATKLPEPKTMDDVINIARAFKAADPTRYGLALNKDVVANGFMDITGIANAYGAYPRTWFEKDGKLVYGSIQPEMKTAIGYYADLFKEGLIDPEFGVKDGGTAGADLTSSKCGVIIGNFWLESWPLNSLYDTDGVDWDVYPLLPFANSTAKIKVQTDTPKGAMLCVKKGYANPEVIMKVWNFTTAKLNDPERAQTDIYHTTPAPDKFNIHGLAPLGYAPSPMMTNFNTNPNVTNAIDKNDKSFLKTPHDLQQYDSVKPYFDSIAAGTKPTAASWVTYKFFYGPKSTFGVQNYYFDNDSYFTSKVVGYESPEMARKQGSLQQNEVKFITEVIAGKKPISDFDAYVQEWRDLGGELIEFEVNEWWNANK